ncbi:MAG: NAD(P)H-dependent oxidoreductase subunit E [Clostridia bacterium]|nr:NAD(P)H-dependent oxidoreductase subunit E [Clostridia bacterium]MBR6556644.1 NAD(P)H-dependent oxidoreductase subunit E [Clostridia bacterium]
MAKKKTMVPFKGTPEQEKKLLEVIHSHQEAGKLMPILQEAQEIYGYLPVEVQAIISRETGISMSEIYGVVTFYAQFNLNPKGKYNIAVCLGTACYVKGAGDVIDKIKQILKIDVDEITPDGKFSLEATRCIGACGLAPVLTIAGEVYGRLTADMMPDILKKYMEMD